MRNLTWRQIAVILGCVLTLATLAVGVYGLVRGPQSAESTPAPPPPGEFGAISLPSTTGQPTSSNHSRPGRSA